MAKTSHKTMNYIDQYQKENVRKIMIKVNKKTEPEVYEWIELQDNKQGYILGLIRNDIHKQKGRIIDGKNKSSSNQSEH